MEAVFDYIDDLTVAIYLLVDASQVVFLQGYFECHEGIGTVRTLNLRKSLVSVLTTPTMLDNCLLLLESIKDHVSWKMVSRPEEADKDLFLGYFKKNR